jgi:hypothetical protein
MSGKILLYIFYGVVPLKQNTKMEKYKYYFQQSYWLIFDVSETEYKDA